MLVKVLSIGKGLRTGGALAGGILTVAGEFAIAGSGRAFPAVGGSLLHTMDRCQMSLEDVGSVEALFGWRPRSWAEAADHGAFVVGQGVSVLIVLSSEAFLVIFTGQDGAFFGPFRLMGQHMSLEVLEDFATVGVGTSSLLAALIVLLRGDGAGS